MFHEENEMYDNLCMTFALRRKEEIVRGINSSKKKNMTNYCRCKRKER